MKYKLIFSLIISFSLFSFSSSFAETITDSAEADVVPWSGYWWPFTEGGLATGFGYRGHPAPTEKYELATNGYYPGEATFWELAVHYSPDALHWYGLCAAWASAAVTEGIDFSTSSYENIIFFVGDKKGLLTAGHGNDIKEMASVAGSPDVFHQWLLHYIKDNGLAFVGELEPSTEFWSYPVYKYAMEITESESTMSVSCRIWYVDDFVHPDFQGARILTRGPYTYDLYLNADGEITGGEWTGFSTYDHPGLIWRPILPRPLNPYLDYEAIRHIAESQDDPFEGNGPVNLPPGAYNLVLLDEDRYRIIGKEGDTVFFSLEAIDNLSEGIALEIKDADGATVYTAVVTDREEVSFSAEKPPYLVTVSREDYGQGGVYSVELDLKTGYEFLIPKIRKGGAWVGMALTNGGDIACENIYIVGCREGGGVISTLMGPFSLFPGEKQTVLLSNLPVRKHEQFDLFSIKVLSRLPLSVVSLSGNQNRNLSGLSGIRESSRLVIPEITGSTNYSTTVWWGICNPEISETEINLGLYSREGLFLEEKTAIIPANGSLSYSPSQTPFHGDGDGGWVLVEGPEGTKLSGYSLWLMNSSEKGESLFALNNGATRFFVPHIVDVGLGKTGLTLINLSDRENAISFTLVAGEEREETLATLNPFEKRVVDVQALFPSFHPELFRLSSLLLESEQEVTGFFSYEISSSLAYFPLLSEEEIQQDLLVTHVASNDYWWTGVAIYNPNNDPVIVSIRPYNNQGMVMADQIREIILNRNEKKVFCVGKFFDAYRIADISFLKIQADTGPGVAGLYLYGDGGRRVLSGSIMQGVEE